MLDCSKEPFYTISKSCLASSFPSLSSSTSSLMSAICSHAVCVLSFLSSMLAYTFPDILGRLLPQQFAHCILLHFLCTWMIGISSSPLVQFLSSRPCWHVYNTVHPSESYFASCLDHLTCNPTHTLHCLAIQPSNTCTHFLHQDLLYICRFQHIVSLHTSLYIVRYVAEKC